MWREILSRARNPRETKIAIIQTIVTNFNFHQHLIHNFHLISHVIQLKITAIMLGLIFFKLSIDQAGVQNINGLLFILCVNSTFTSTFPAINSILPLVPLFLRENKSGMYRVINFYFSKFLVDVSSLRSCFLLILDF